MLSHVPFMICWPMHGDLILCATNLFGFGLALRYLERFYFSFCLVSDRYPICSRTCSLTVSPRFVLADILLSSVYNLPFFGSLPYTLAKPSNPRIMTSSCGCALIAHPPFLSSNALTFPNLYLATAMDRSSLRLYVNGNG